MRLGLTAYVVSLGVISCGGGHAPQPSLPAVSQPCSAFRIGEVAVTGAPIALVPALAVLQGTADDPDRTERVRALAVDRLHSLGYAKAEVKLARSQACFVDLNVEVALGPKYEIRAIEFHTAPGDDFPARERLAAIADALGTVNTIGGTYVEYRLQRALAQLQERYRDAGWLEAAIGKPAAILSDDHTITLEIPVTPGARFRVAAIRARGAGAQARAAVLEEIAIEPGGWYDGAAIRTGIERARRKLDRWVELRTVVSTDGQIELEAVLEAR